MRLSPEIVRYTALGLQRHPNGAIVRTNHVFAKVSRAEVAEQFMAPAPEAILNALVSSGAISAEQAELASRVPVAAEITAEADSGGHTDRRASRAPLSPPFVPPATASPRRPELIRTPSVSVWPEAWPPLRPLRQHLEWAQLMS
jgi:NAD(P)H-dependent flavin oxidoreductase YrpB (nitropropane dioxygenase family)